MSDPTSAHYITTTDAPVVGGPAETSTSTTNAFAPPTATNSVRNNEIEPAAAEVGGTTAASYSNPRRPSIQEAEDAVAEAERRGSLAPTPNPMNPDAITTENATSDQIPPASSVGTQNAPGPGGKFGEAVMGGFGYGGSAVERPKEEQGIAEKIVNILGG